MQVEKTDGSSQGGGEPRRAGVTEGKRGDPQRARLVVSDTSRR